MRFMLTTHRIWKLAEGGCEQILQGHTGRVNSIKLCDTNHTAVTVSDDFTARVWDWSTGECRHVLEGHGGWLSDMALLPNATRAVTVSGDDLAVVWDLEEGKCCNVLEGHSGETSSVVLTRRGRFVTVLLAHRASHFLFLSFVLSEYILLCSCKMVYRGPAYASNSIHAMPVDELGCQGRPTPVVAVLVPQRGVMPACMVCCISPASPCPNHDEV